jgi:hypothetical protein
MMMMMVMMMKMTTMTMAMTMLHTWKEHPKTHFFKYSQEPLLIKAAGLYIYIYISEPFLTILFFLYSQEPFRTVPDYIKTVFIYSQEPFLTIHN